MGAVKLNYYSPTQVRKSKLAKAISVPARIQILKLIHENGSVNGNELLTVLPLSQPTIHHHLSILVQSGLICGDFIGAHYFWSLDPSCLEEFDALLWFLD